MPIVNRKSKIVNRLAPYGNPVQNTGGGEPYGYTGEWYESYTELLFLRARWYAPGSGTFLSRDAVESEPPYQYVRGNAVNWVDPSGNTLRPGINLDLNCLLYGEDPDTGECKNGTITLPPWLGNIIQEVVQQPAVDPRNAVIKTVVIFVGVACIYTGIDYLSNSRVRPVDVNVEPQIQVDVNPGPQLDPRLKPTTECNCPFPLPTPTPQEPGQMVVQLQQSRSGTTLYTEGVPVVEQQPLGRGVTVRQVQRALGELYSRAPGLDWFKNTYIRQLRKAIVETSEILNTYPTLGVQGHKYMIKKSFDGPERSEYRVDVENKRGWNLRFHY